MTRCRAALVTLLPARRAICAVGLAAVVASAPVVLLAAPASAATPAYVSMDRVLHMLDRVSVAVGSRHVRVRSASTLCAGTGPAVRHNGTRRWHRFLCTYTTFTRAGVDRDIEFLVYVRSPTRLAIANAHWVAPVP